MKTRNNAKETGDRDKVSGSGFRVSSFEFRVSGFGFRVSGFEFSGLLQTSNFKLQPVVFLFCFVFLGDALAQPSRRSVEAGKVMVKLKPDAVSVFETGLRALNTISSDTAVLNTGVKSFDAINRRYGATNMRRVFPDAGEYEAKHRQYGLHLWYELVIPEDKDPDMVAAEYGGDENVQIAEARFKIRNVAMPATPLPIDEPPNDPEFNKQWNFNNTGQTGGTPGADIRLIDAWEKIKSLGIKNNNIIVAVKDDGVYHDHEDLRENFWVNEAELNGISRVDDDRNGYIDDIYGYNFVNRTGTISPDDHGTHVAGVIAAVTNNEVGVSGISGNADEGYGIKIMTVQILNGNSSVSTIGPAFTYAADNGAVISQNSWGYEDPNVYNRVDIEAINYFINEAGKDKNGNPRPGTPMAGGIVIFAAGNDGKDDKWYPAYFDNVMAVAATNHNGKLAWYSNFGKWIDISAPGGETRVGNNTGGIYSTSYRAANNNFYEYKQGTSMACPHVSGVAALILSVFGNESFTPDMLRSRLLLSATPLDSFDPENASMMGAGLVNASTAMSIHCVQDAVTDLEAQTINAVSCSLNWTITSEGKYDGSNVYTVACANELITEDNFDHYIHQSVTASLTAETGLQAIVTDLQPATLYYIAIRNENYLCDESAISNVVTVTTRSNSAPVASNPLPDMILRDVAEETALYIGNVFTDTDDDEMTYEISVAFANIASAKIEGNSVLIQPIAAGITTLTLTADDGNTGRTSSSLTLTVTQNHAPVINGLFADTTLIPISDPIAVDLARYSYDPEGDPITYSVQTIKSNIVSANINGSMLTISSLIHGFETLQITASDPYAAKTTETIHVTVEQKYAPTKANRLLLYPNPTKDILWYSYILSEPASVNVRIVNALGQIMYQTTTEKQSAGVYYNNIQISPWDTGIYLVYYMVGGKIKDTKKFVKQ